MRRSRVKQFALLAAAVVMAALTGIAVGAELAQQTSRERGVTVRVKPVGVSASARAWAFEIILDTHSQDLSDDLVSIATLNSGDGAPHKPTAWEGDPPGGHHRKGLLRFAPLTPAPETVELRILRPGESAPRSFRWSLQ